MSLDVRTILVMFSILTPMFSGLLALAGLHAGGIKGIGRWAAANLCFSVGFGLAYFYNFLTPGYHWAVVVGSVTISTGLSLQFTGIQEFKGMRSDWRLAALFVGAVFFQGVWFTIIRPDISVRAITNSLFFAFGYIACARALLVSIASPLRTAYWFTGLSFAVLAMVMVVRAVVIWLSPPGTYNLYLNIAINPLSFFIGVIVQLCVTFGFVLMLNYRLNAEILNIASRDVLTGAYNRRRLEEEAIRLLSHCERTRDTLAVMMLDIDHFKAVNDRYGHPAGDEVLRRLAAVAHTSLRTDDFFARYGGEEFCILLLSTTEGEAMQLAERLREAQAAMTVEFGPHTLKTTVSIGVADSIHAGLEFSSLVAAADQALYRAKQEGRNRVAAYSAMLT